MLKSTFLLLLIFATPGLTAQESRTRISGKIKSDEKNVKDIHIINMTSNKGSISSKQGNFTIRVKYGDTIVFRGLQFESKKIIISKTEINNKSLLVELLTKTNVLDEVKIKKPENMAQELNLPNAGKKPLKGVDLKLAYYSQESTPMVILATLLGKQGGIDDIYNIISGNRKKHRKLKKLIEEDKLLEFKRKVYLHIRKHFKDDFFIYTLKIPSKKIDHFIKYCEPKEIVPLYNKERYLEITDVLIKESKPFLKNLKDEK